MARLNNGDALQNGPTDRCMMLSIGGAALGSVAARRLGASRRVTRPPAHVASIDE